MGFYLTGAFPPNFIFSAPSGITTCWMQICFRGAKMVWTSCITMPSLVGLRLRVPQGVV